MSTIQNTDDRDTVHPEDGPLKVAIAIVAHKDRGQTGRPIGGLGRPDYVSWDDGTLGPAENHLRAWENLAEEDAEVCLVLEDDAVPVANFRSELSGVLAVAPTDLVSLYLGRATSPLATTLAKVFGSLDRRPLPKRARPVLADRRRGTARRGAGDETLPDRRHLPVVRAPPNPAADIASPSTRRSGHGHGRQGSGCPIVFVNRSARRPADTDHRAHHRTSSPSRSSSRRSSPSCATGSTPRLSTTTFDRAKSHCISGMATSICTSTMACTWRCRPPTSTASSRQSPQAHEEMSA